MIDPRDYKLDIAGVKRDDAAGNARREPRAFVSVLFKCCGVYQRIYRSNDGASYDGRCPRCARPIRFVVGDRGTDARFFEVS